ncbi:hypothetical protein L208DRAFT_1230849, partial [Tricholoma matsutake]
MIRHQSAQFVVVPSGPAIPRCDRPHAYARYCHLMLVLFKPWQEASDLRDGAASWSEAFDLFVTSQGPEDYVVHVMNNMQILHECRDSRNDH